MEGKRLADVADHDGSWILHVRQGNVLWRKRSWLYGCFDIGKYTAKSRRMWCAKWV